MLKPQARPCFSPVASFCRLYEIAMQHIEHGVVSQNGKDLRCRMDVEAVAFPQRQQSADMIDIGIGQHHVAEGTVPGRMPGTQEIECGDLFPDVGGAVQQAPVPAVGGNGQAGLGAAFHARIA